jgi:predicted nucleic acid-binding protein
MKALYVDSSVLVAVALQDTDRASNALKKIKGFEIVLTSELAVVECQAGLCTQLADDPELLTEAEQKLNQLLVRLVLYSVDSLVLGHARALVKRYRQSIGLRTLDAIHVATANLFGTEMGGNDAIFVEYLTSDKKQHSAFTAEGYVGNYLQ